MGDWSSATYIISQIATVIGYIFFGASYLINNKQKRFLILIVVLCGNFFLGLAYGFLIAWVGAGMCFIAIIRDVVNYILNSRRTDENRLKITHLDCVLLGIWLTIIVTFTYFTQDGFMSWFACFSTAMFTVSIWQKNVLVYKIMGICSGMLWIVYNVYVENPTAIVMRTVLAFVTLYGIYLYFKKNKRADTKFSNTSGDEISYEA
jgi:phosphatidylglycerophosphate synthase